MNFFSAAGRVLGVLPLLGAILLVSGCSAGGAVSMIREIAQARQQFRQIQQQSGTLPMTDVTTGEATPLAPDEAAIQLALQNNSAPQIVPSNSGPGLVVCEPVLAGQSTPDASAANFAAGCGRWLHLSAAGLPQFGKTPSWYGFDYALREMGKNNARLDAKEAAQLAKITAATHIATGELGDAQAGSTLTYHLWKMPGQKEVGAPLVIRGTRAQIAAGLPAIAKTLVTRLKGDASLAPQKIEVSASELETIGRAPRQTELALEADIAQKLKTLAARSPVAGIEYLAHLSAVESAIGTITATQDVEKLASAMYVRSPQNTLVLAQVTSLAAPVLEKSKTRQQLEMRFPNNYLLAYGETTQHNRLGNRAAQKQAAQRAIAASPRSAWAWLQLETELANEARDVRRGRYMNQMTAAERRTIAALYPQMSQASLQAIRCDPLNAEAWNRLSYSEAAGGDDALAEAAFWKSISLPSRTDDTYDWGLELFQAKWQGDINKLGRVARIIAVDKPRFLRMSSNVTQAFSDSGWNAQANQFAKLASAAHENWLAAHPHDTRSRYEYARTLQENGDVASATKQFQLVVKQQPKSDNAYYQLALLAEEQRNWKLAAQNYEKVLAIVPTHRSALFRCGQAYHEARRFSKAEPLYLKAIALYPNYAEPYNRLGDLYFFVKNDKKGAEKLYRTALSLSPNDQQFRDNLQRCLDSQ